VLRHTPDPVCMDWPPDRWPAGGDEINFEEFTRRLSAAWATAAARRPSRCL